MKKLQFRMSALISMKNFNTMHDLITLMPGAAILKRATLSFIVNHFDDIKDSPWMAALKRENPDALIELIVFKNTSNLATPSTQT
jgi:hypothetical protein